MDSFSAILKVIKRIQRRLVWNACLSYGLSGGMAGLFLGALVNFWAIFFPVMDADVLGMCFGGLGVLTGIAWAVVKRPTLSRAALYGDSKGLKESLVTALERREKQDLFSAAQREQTKELLEQFDLPRRIPVRVPLSSLAMFGLAALCLTVCILIPSQAKETAREQKVLQAMIKEQIEQVEALKEEIAKLDVPEPAAQEARRVI